MSDCLIVGGGVIGLSLAYELAGQGAAVRVIDAGQPGREASWAGAGILTPAASSSDDPLQQLAALSNQLHPQWSQELLATVGIDNGYRRTAAVYVARDAVERGRLEFFAALASRHGIVFERVANGRLDEIEPGLCPAGTLEAAYLAPEECQIRNPRHLKALLAGCAARGVEITAGMAAEDFEIRGDRIRSVRTATGTLAADQVCLASGAWSGALARRLGATIAVKPLRGQMVLFASAKPIVRRIINEGSRYLVPRPDGRLLCGSTEEDVGFDRGTTAGAIAGLLQFAFSLAPELESATIERTWAGLRPMAIDGMPYLGRIGELNNGFVAAGHFRSGLHLSTGTATVMAQCIAGRRPQIDLAPFDPNRNAESAPVETKRTRQQVSLG